MSGPLKHHKLLRIPDRQRAKESRVNQAKDGGVGADAEGEGKHGDGGEAGRFAEHAEGEAQILQKRVGEGQAAAFAIDLASLFEAAEVEKRLTAGLLPVHALREVALDGHLQVRTEFGIEVAVEAAAAKESDEAGD